MKAMANHGSQGAVAFDPGWKAILECAALEVFEMMAGARLEINPAPTSEPQGEQTAMVGMAGALCGMTTLRCSRGGFGEICVTHAGRRRGIQSFRCHGRAW